VLPCIRHPIPVTFNPEGLNSQIDQRRQVACTFDRHVLTAWRISIRLVKRQVNANKKRTAFKTGKQRRPAKKRAQPKATKNAASWRPKLKKLPAKNARAKAHKGAARSYSMATIKELFGLCSNQCAFPDCTNQIVAVETKWSKAAVVGHTCHIYAASDKGPRGKPGLTEKERNSPGNLILMCGDHHPRVDKQWQTYPATKLKKWKKAHEAKATKGTAEAIKHEADIEKHVFFEEMSDDQIEKALARIRCARYLVGFPAVEEAQTLATQVEQSRYSSGSAETRARALAWCARILSQGKPKHAARQRTTEKVWTSKIGDLDDIDHTLDGLAGNNYGKPTLFMRRKLST
jgi:hypothetical protein